MLFLSLKDIFRLTIIHCSQNTAAKASVTIFYIKLYVLQIQITSYNHISSIQYKKNYGTIYKCLYRQV